MTVAATLDLLRRAQHEGYAVGAFNVIGIEHGEAIVRAAELEQAPVIVQVSENSVRFRLGALGPIGACCIELARAARVPVAVHLDHATSWALCEQALDVGFGSVMFDASALPFEANMNATADAVKRAHARGAMVEAELGVVGGKGEPAPAHGGRTDPDEARQYVAATGVDALAVAVGTSHQMLQTTAQVDLALVSRLAAAVPVPLVLHGSSGVADADLASMVRRGMVKVNIATQLNKAFTRAVRQALAEDERVVDPRTYLGPARDATVAVVRDRLRLLGSAGRAECV